MRITAFTALAVAAASAAGGQADSLADARMAGHWRGEARIATNWTTQRVLLVDLTIHADGKVGGLVGDARLTNGRLRSNRGWLLRALDWKTDWIIAGTLEGPIIAAEGVTRDGVNIPLNWTGTEFTGSVHTTGSEFGGKARMKVTGIHLVLTRPPGNP